MGGGCSALRVGILSYVTFWLLSCFSTTVCACSPSMSFINLFDLHLFDLHLIYTVVAKEQESRGQGANDEIQKQSQPLTPTYGS